ncbi:hypothetical protein [Hymenobacter cellulosilyticus]|uniref:Uncharacterized protein n=1 Tax=Hymenobacter cellulosilyticus TaxID=2932248 RepID=A0A8T9Q7I3_9BACT|nr:hypothetical protein [Hymenobacter cellulosilyticus]UOQ71469.1 hypothetical protein MUN79_23070 [Hymenobacter cellulosilyticus]
MKPLHFLLLFSLLLVAGCDKDDNDQAPSKAGQLSAVTWRESSSSLVVNGVEGIQTISATSADTYQFGTDGKVAVTKPGGIVTTGTWALAGNDTQLTVTLGGQTQTQQIFALTATGFSLGAAYTQAQVQAALAGQPVAGVPNGLISLIILSAGNFTFPAGTPPVNANQITSLQLRTNLVPK